MSTSDERKPFTTTEVQFLEQGEEMDRAAQAQLEAGDARQVDDAPAAPTGGRDLGIAVRWRIAVGVAGIALLIGVAVWAGARSDVQRPVPLTASR
jgi:hypothetical protein